MKKEKIIKEIYLTWKCRKLGGDFTFWELFIWRWYHKFIKPKLDKTK